MLLQLNVVVYRFLKVSYNSKLTLPVLSTQLLEDKK